MNWKVCRRKYRLILGISLTLSSRDWRNLCKISMSVMCPTQDSNWDSTEYQTEALPVEPSSWIMITMNSNAPHTRWVLQFLSWCSEMFLGKVCSNYQTVRWQGSEDHILSHGSLMHGQCAAWYPPFYVSLQLALFKLYNVPPLRPPHGIKEDFCLKDLKSLSSRTMQASRCLLFL